MVGTKSAVTINVFLAQIAKVVRVRLAPIVQTMKVVVTVYAKLAPTASDILVQSTLTAEPAEKYAVSGLVRMTLMIQRP